ncbi:MAG: type III toxin-antitoxin system ToxN/AbiQ family toxin [Lachnospiraceae bacterium]|nr:type III toxin-antitoxin system ToxN/AbiQ family toxin [Lachnospiraceae bacterium]
MVEEFKVYSVSDAYISYLREHEPNVYSNKEDNRTHTRKYIGIVIEMNGFNYYIPMSSPKDSDYQVAGDGKVIKKSIVPIMRITEKSNGVKELKGTLRISHMIPVPEAELTLYDLDHEEDLDYKALVSAEIIFIRKHADKIRDNAELLYKQKMKNDETAGYVKSALNYLELEKLCQQYSNDGK